MPVNLPVMGYRNCRMMTINVPVHQLCREEEVGFEGMFARRAAMFTRGGPHLCGKVVAEFTDEHLGTVDSGIGSIENICSSKHCLN